MRKETPVSQLPRPRRDPAVLAKRQGLDDGYFGKIIVDVTNRQYGVNYLQGYNEGKAQRESAEKAEKKRKVK